MSDWASLVGAWNGRCYWNAIAVLRLMDDPDARYVEGLVMDTQHGVPIPHGWVELDGEVHDATPWTRTADCAYFPERRYSLTQIRAIKKDRRVHLWDSMPLPVERVSLVTYKSVPQTTP